MRAFFALLIVFVTVDYAFGSCGVCGSKSKVVCRDKTTFSFCIDDNNVDSAVYSCPYGLVCGNDIRICAPEPEEPCNPACGNCTSRFACLSETTYALCFGQAYPSGTIYPCPEGQLCSTKKSNGLNFCVDKDSVHHEEIDCYKNIVVTIDESNGGVVLLPPVY
ncbi:unnamed protein product [Hermetia illucens]|uniref:Uncharacterized protein n=1 Tax=Hermetia illucens TaxID=343691 RepID=A0A7R8YR11_HERIL|nr:uncharacterized protein LOC119648736 [Hermetia illucens]CAD7082218.1 unnamed protein product [Hermetia illucens]